MRTIIATVGTSLLSNAQRANVSGGAAALANYLAHTDPVKACAETNSLHRMALTSDDKLVLVHSDTEDGALVAELLCAHFTNARMAARHRAVADLHYEARAFKQRGLRNLVFVLAEEVRRARRDMREPVINATGGFKAETAYATLVGLLMRTKVCYIHEKFGEIVYLPELPLDWDFALMDEHADFIEWIEQEPRPSGDVRERARNMPASLRLLLAEPDEGFQMLSPAGVAYFEAYRDRIESAPRDPVLLSEQAWRTLDASEPATREAYQKLLDKLAIAGMRQPQSNIAWAGGPHVYPRGRRNERALYTQTEDTVNVLELCRHSDGSYERLMTEKPAISRYKSFRSFSPSTSPT